MDIFTLWNSDFCHKKIHKEDLQVAKQNDAGVYKLKNGNWAYRYVLMVNGIRKEVRKAKDEFGASFKTKREAIKARQAPRTPASQSPRYGKRFKRSIKNTVSMGGMIEHIPPNASRTAFGKTTFAPGSGRGTLMKSARRK